MSTLLNDYLQQLQEKKEKALIPFIVAGYPDLEKSVQLAVDILDSGGDILELGLPYSDPMADGPVIEQASHHAVSQGITTKHVLEIVKKIKKQRNKPIVLLSYYNPILKYGIKNFVRDFASAGLSGLVIPDLPPEEREELYDQVKGKLSLIPLVSPVTKNERLEKILHNSEGFVYCISRLGTTGEREQISFQGEQLIHRSREITDLPLMLGFGIKNPEQASEVSAYASGVIVGSAIMNKIINSYNHNQHIKGDYLKEQVADESYSNEDVKNFVARLKSAISSV